ncbi:MAG: tRNA pseudouridine(55) synthase TruB [Acidobacteria bacterium]|nr:MAG: tRNA pseudouridine(55) synthase TruB [Acidobacteriota bacterium]
MTAGTRDKGGDYVFHMDGIFIIDKPAGMTSHDVVNTIRAKFSVSKAGHFGTLDPMATGVLPISAGKATRLGQFIPNGPKEYIGEIRFGFSTDTYDRDGGPTSEERPLHHSEQQIADAIRSFTGVLSQVPPAFSAKKIGGVPSYKLARKNRPVRMAPIQVEVYQFEMLRLEPPVMAFRVVCSPGTYVRSLGHDLGQALGCGAHLTALRRTRSGDFRLEHAVQLERVSGGDLIPMSQLLQSWPRIEVSGTEERKVLHGNQIPGDGLSELARIFNKKGEFIAVATVENGWVRPRLVLTSNTSD